MRRIALLAVVAGMFAPVIASQPAHAQATRTWVSGVGDEISENLGTGLALTGGAGVRIGCSVIVNNWEAATSGNVLSYLDNLINGNAPDTKPATAGGYH
ncbi:hypothetical protein JQ544_25915 [Bradyrhizobium diazoefficiens]|nr:hypothetical protein [Bradyrhizobium diazoefficiens]MBR0814993.1 hypothetical protein [Bradyrhizobium diazoefficiens]